ncbi:hypothetical protein Sango_1156300 [Sesamum angolense]|uniref:Uncharacterized protein n=1 Tax=Sesamum angolense TaxID=2727404 RepID=A0AAE2BWM3_9LAMI|nr:hypothetical protein Sango_1156300 [Sesamum angolense]
MDVTSDARLSFPRILYPFLLMAAFSPLPKILPEFSFKCSQKWRTRTVFDIALKVHLKIQERDIEVGRNLGNWILRWLDRMKPEAQIRGPHPPGTNANTNVPKQTNNTSDRNNRGGFPKYSGKSMDKESDRHLFTAARNVWPKPFPTIATMMRPTRPAGHNIQYRQYSAGASELLTVKYSKFGFGEVIRNDIRQWILQH